MQDPWYFEKIAHFDREVIPERRMHAKGAGAYGTFTVTHDITRYTRASIFAEVGKQTECFVRFSTVAGERGAADAERDIRGFAMKFYTDAGNWDLVGNNTPVFFLRDPLKFADLNHAIKRDPRTGMRSPNNNWDFWTLLPEALHQVTITMSPRGIPASFRHMHGFGSHTYSFYDKENRRTWVKFHFRTLQGIKNLTDAEAEAVIAKDRESNQRDLFEAIERGDYPRWLLQVQLMTEEQARTYEVNPFDLTKVWYHGDFPLHDVGILELNRNPENFFAEVEQAAFDPLHTVEGIGFSPDKMLQGRLLSYGDAQRYRLGSQLQPDSRQPPALSRPRLPPRRPDAHRRQLRPHARLRAQQLRRMARHAGAQGAAPAARRPGLQLRRTGARRRLLHAAGQALAADVARRSEGDVRKHGTPHGRRGALHQATPRAQLLLRRSGLRARRGRSAGHLVRRGAPRRGPGTPGLGSAHQIAPVVRTCDEGRMPPARNLHSE